MPTYSLARMKNQQAKTRVIVLKKSRNEVAEAASNCLTRHLILVYSRGCCNVFKDLSGSKMSFFPNEGGLVFEASSSYKNMYDEIFII
jgi:hypothetical protein